MNEEYNQSLALGWALGAARQFESPPKFLFKAFNSKAVPEGNEFDIKNFAHEAIISLSKEVYPAIEEGKVKSLIKEYCRYEAPKLFVEWRDQ